MLSCIQALQVGSRDDAVVHKGTSGNIVYDSLRLQIRFSGRSLIKIRNSRGPMIDPWGTPDFIGFQEEVTPLIITL